MEMQPATCDLRPATCELKQYLPVSLIVLAFVALATLYSVVTPLGEGPDEPGHARYMFFLAREGRLPVQQADPAKSDAPGEGHQPPLAYALAAPLAAWLPREERQFDMPGTRASLGPARRRGRRLS